MGERESPGSKTSGNNPVVGLVFLSPLHRPQMLPDKNVFAVNAEFQALYKWRG